MTLNRLISVSLPTFIHRLVMVKALCNIALGPTYHYINTTILFSTIIIIVDVAVVVVVVLIVSIIIINICMGCDYIRLNISFIIFTS